MLWVGFRDLQWRLRRFIIGVIATGPFTSTQFMAASEVAQVRELSGVEEAAPLVLFRQTVFLPGVKDLNVVGAEPGEIGSPEVKHGRSIRGPGEVVVDSSLGAKIGSTLSVKGHTFRVVGTTRGLTYFGGGPVAFIRLRDAQDLLFLGQPLASTIVTRGTPRDTPPGMRVLTNGQVRADMYRPISQASGTIQVLDILLLLIAAGIIGAILYMSTLERMKDFAVMKATGAGNGFVLAGLIAQAMVLSATSAVVAIVLAQLIAPLVPSSVEIPLSSYGVLVVTALVVGIVGSLAGLRRALSVDPALAFAG